MKSLLRCRPEDVGIPPSAIQRFVQALSQADIEMHSVLLARHGKVAFEAYFEPFTGNLKHNLYSCTKSVTATAVGFAIDEGLISLDDHIVDWLPDKLLAEPHPYVAAMTIDHLLKMSTAFSAFVDPVTDDWTREFLNAKPDHFPGTLFGYDTSGTHVLGEVVQRATGEMLIDYLTPRLFTPLGIDDVEWEISPSGINRGGGGLRMTTESMAKFGILYAANGYYEGEKILPEGWAAMATRRHVDNSNSFGMHGTNGYGYQFWCMSAGRFACMGLGGQLIICDPRLDLVFVTTANNLRADAGQYLAMCYFLDYVLPAIDKDTCPIDENAFRYLMQFAQEAKVRLPKGIEDAQTGNVFWGETFAASYNPLHYESVTLTRLGEGGQLLFKREDGEIDAIPFGLGTYALSDTPLQRTASHLQYWGRYTFPNEAEPRNRLRAASAGVWTDSSTLIIQSHLLETVQSHLITCHFGSPYGALQIKPYGIYTYDALPVAFTLSHKRSNQSAIAWT